MTSSDGYFYPDPDTREWAQFLENAEPPEWLSDEDPEIDLDAVDFDA